MASASWWSPLGRGFLSGKYRRGEAPPQGSRLASWKDSWQLYADNDKAWKTLDAAQNLAAARGTTSSAVSLKQLDESRAAAELKTLNEVSQPEWGYPVFVQRRPEAW